MKISYKLFKIKKNMIRIPKISEGLNKNLKKGEIRLAHWPNKTLCWATKNQVGEIRYFDLKSPWPNKIVERFSKSKSFLY